MSDLDWIGLTLRCGLPIAIAVLLVWGRLSVIRSSNQNLEEIAEQPPEMPPEFRPRCPMCGSQDLEWGVYFGQGYFVHRTLPSLTKYHSRGRAARHLAASCNRCDYILLFDRTIDNTPNR